MEGIYDLARASYDVDNPPGTRPSVSYVVCSTPRCGSTLLTEGMLATRQMGIPVEYFNRVYMPPLAARWGVSRLDAYVARLLERRTDASGGFGIKIHWAQLMDVFGALQRGSAAPLDGDAGAGPPPDPASAATRYRAVGSFLTALFPNIRFIHITRLNRLRQAVSWYVASRTGRWSSLSARSGAAGAPAGATLPYDRETIVSYLLSIDAAEAAWREFFRANGIFPLTIIYEEFAAGYVESMAELMRLMGMEPLAIPEPRLRRQAGEDTEPLVRQLTHDLHAHGLQL